MTFYNVSPHVVGRDLWVHFGLSKFLENILQSTSFKTNVNLRSLALIFISSFDDKVSGARNNIDLRRPMCQILHQRSSRGPITSKFSRTFSQVLKTPDKYLSLSKAVSDPEKIEIRFDFFLKKLSLWCVTS